MESALSEGQATEILALAGIRGDVSVSLLKKHNHVFKIDAGDAVYFLKTYTKDWYADFDTGVVRHEAAGYAALSARQIPTVPVVLSRPDGDNPLGRPFLLTRQLRGSPLTELLRKSSGDDFKALLRETGKYLRRCHQIVFRFPGYIGQPEGPQEAPAPGGWLHYYCSAARMQEECLARLNGDKSGLSPDLVKQLQTKLSTMQKTLEKEYDPPRFIQGDCHAHQIYLYKEQGGWSVSGAVDMEVAASGAPICDLLKFCHEMSADFSIDTRWWEPFFEGYGEPDFENLRLVLLGDPPGPRKTVAPRLLAAGNWEQLFNAGRSK